MRAKLPGNMPFGRQPVRRFPQSALVEVQQYE